MGVIAIGGLFFRARDPEALSAWYRTHLNVGAGCVGHADDAPDEWSWRTQGGPTVFAPFKATTDYWPADKAFMINLRVAGIDSLLNALEGEGIEVITKPEWDDPSTGRFARIHDPEGNPIELWEPPAAA